MLVPVMLLPMSLPAKLHSEVPAGVPKTKETSPSSSIDALLSPVTVFRLPSLDNSVPVALPVSAPARRFACTSVTVPLNLDGSVLKVSLIDYEPAPFGKGKRALIADEQ